MGTPNISEQASLVKTSEKPIIARTLRERDAYYLEYYFGEGRTVFQRSTFGAMLTRADLYRHGTFPCFSCEGSPGVSAATGEWCRSCRGTGFYSFERSASKDSPPVTVCPSKAAAEPSGYEPSHQALQIFGRIGRRLDIVAERGGRHFPKVLELAHGDEGARWANTKMGRLFALHRLVAPGRRLLARSRDDGAHVELIPSDALKVQVELQRTQPKAWRRKLIEETLEQAKELYGDAVQAWNLSALFVRAQRHQAPPPSRHSAAPALYPTVRELIDKPSLLEPRPHARKAPDYVDPYQEQCRGPKCSRSVSLPEIYCEPCQDQQRRLRAEEQRAAHANGEG